ncbi:hypothetical protein JOB18_041757 [Solea senegalensis]|nr:hypothetical protein JOB18_041757 [Solea senegalensis]
MDKGLLWTTNKDEAYLHYLAPTLESSSLLEGTKFLGGFFLNGKNLHLGGGLRQHPTRRGHAAFFKSSVCKKTMREGFRYTDFQSVLHFYSTNANRKPSLGDHSFLRENDACAGLEFVIVCYYRDVIDGDLEPCGAVNSSSVVFMARDKAV